MKDRESDPADAAQAEDAGKDTGVENNVIDVECGLNKAVLHLDRLCQGSKGACILFEKTWMTPNEFQAASGRETAKDWKRSIKHHDKSLKLLMIKGLFSTDPAVCSCDYCTGTETPPPSPSTSPITKEVRMKKAPAGNNDSTEEVIVQQAKNGRKKRRKAKPPAPVARQLRNRSARVNRRNNPRVSTRTSPRVETRTGRRRANVSSESGSEKSDTEPEESDENEQESSTDEAEESLPLADVKKGLCAKSKPVPAKGKGGRKAAPKAETSPGDDASDATRGDGVEIEMNCAENDADETKVCDTKCTETVEGGSTVESRPTRSDNECSTDIGKAAEDASVKHDVNKGREISETAGSDESTLQNDARNSKTLKTETEKGAPVENSTTPRSDGAESKTFATPESSSCDENNVTAPGARHSAQAETIKAEKSQSRIGGSAPGEVVFEAPAATPQADKSVEDAEPANGNTAVATLAVIPTPNDSDNAIDTEHGDARSDASLPKEERNATTDSLAPTKDQTRADTDDVTGQDGGEETSSEDHGELPSPKREARLLSIIQELKTYKKRLVTKIEAKKRTSGESPVRDDDSPHPSDGSKEDTGGCPSVTLDCPSQAIPPASSSPLQQLLFEPNVCPVLSHAQPLAETPSHVPEKRRRTGSRRPVSFSTPQEGLLTSRPTALSHVTNCNGVAVGPPSAVVAYCIDAAAPTAGSIGAEHSTLAPGKLPGYAVARGYDVANRGVDDKCLLKIPKRCNANVVPGSARDRSATVALLDLSAQKRKSSEQLPEVAMKKQRGSWPVAIQAHVGHAVNINTNSTSNNFVTSISSVPSTSAVSLYEVSRTGRPRSDLRPAPVMKVAATSYSSKPARRPHISSWSADDVFAFVLSTPHASIYAKEFLELRITGRVLQNLTAIQMMRILRIGEHAARAVRTAVEKILEMTPALTQGVRR